MFTINDKTSVVKSKSIDVDSFAGFATDRDGDLWVISEGVGMIFFPHSINVHKKSSEIKQFGPLIEVDVTITVDRKS